MQIPAKYRLTLYVVATVALVAVFALGFVSPDQVSAGLDNAAKMVALVATALAMFNVTPDE